MVNLQWHPLRRVLDIEPYNTKLKSTGGAPLRPSNDDKPLRAARCCHFRNSRGEPPVPTVSAKTTKDKHAEMEWKPLHGQTTLRRPRDDTLRNSLSTPATASAIAGVDAFRSESQNQSMRNSRQKTNTRSTIFHNLVVNLQWNPLRRVLAIKSYNTQLKEPEPNRSHASYANKETPMGFLC